MKKKIKVGVCRRDGRAGLGAVESMGAGRRGRIITGEWNDRSASALTNPVLRRIDDEEVTIVGVISDFNIFMDRESCEAP